MSKILVVSIAECTSKPDETYGDQCNRMEKMVKVIVETEDKTVDAIATLAHIMMEVSADFDYSSIYDPGPFKRTRNFLQKQPEEIRELFRIKCEEHSRRNNSRIASLLSMAS